MRANVHILVACAWLMVGGVPAVAEDAEGPAAVEPGEAAGGEAAEPDPVPRDPALPQPTPAAEPAATDAAPPDAANVVPATHEGEVAPPAAAVEGPALDADADGDGVVSPTEVAAAHAYDQAFKDIPREVVPLAARDDANALAPSLTLEEFRNLVAVAQHKVLERMEANLEAAQAKRMARVSELIGWISFAGLLLLLMPLWLRKRYPGRGGMLFKYSALAAVVFVVTVNLFGLVLVILRSVQGALSSATNPQVALARGFFETLHDKAESFLPLAKDLFGPTLAQLGSDTAEAPAAVLIENGQHLVKEAQVFISVAKAFKQMSWVFGYLPIVLTVVTMVLFVLSIKPTMMEIISLPTRAAEGHTHAGREVMKASLRRVFAEFKAAGLTMLILVLVSIGAGVTLSLVSLPALEALINYFGAAVLYLAYVSGAQPWVVFASLFGVLVLLVLNIATLVLSMSFYLGKAQKIFQQKYSLGVPLKQHRRFFGWGTLGLVLVQVFPVLFVSGAIRVMWAINEKIMGGDDTGIESMNWKLLLLLGPVLMVVAFGLTFWLVRGFRAIGFLRTYPAAPKAS